MTKYREIIRLRSLDFSERNIALSCSVSRNTVSKVLKKADELNISWPLDETMTDDALESLLFPKEKSATNKRMPSWTESSMMHTKSISKALIHQRTSP